MTTAQIGTASLTTDHAASSYGIPVLVFEGRAYGPDDMITDIMSAIALVNKILAGMQPSEVSDDLADLCRRYVSASEDGTYWTPKILGNTEKVRTK